jgi:homoserine kinase
VLEQVTAYAPGSVSNLGPGFDCLGIAFTGKGDSVSARRVAEPGVRVASISNPAIPTEAARNTSAIAAAAVLRRFKCDIGLELTVEKGLPLAGGMGGSAASAVAGAVAAAAILEVRAPREELVEAALEAEMVAAGRHADNVAPSLVGGGVLVLGLEPLRLFPVRVHPSVALVLVTPDYRVETAKARSVLPESLERGETIAQAASLAGLVLGLERGDDDLIRAAMFDHVAEPFRRPLYPGYGDARAAAFEAGAYGVAVSGAGPTIIALAHWGVAVAVGNAMVAGYQRAGIPAVAHPAEVDTAGARVIRQG